MDWKAIVSKNVEKKEVKKVNDNVKPNIKEENNNYYHNPDFEFDYKYSERCYNSINRFKKYINRMNEPLFDLNKDFTTNLYNFIKYNSYEYSELLKDIENKSEDEFSEDSEDDYYENF